MSNRKIAARRHTAVHEAGHAVIGRVFRLGCGQASIVADDESTGHSITPDPWKTLGYWWDDLGLLHRDYGAVIRARVMTYMAGRVAEEEVLGSCCGGDGDDRQQIDMMLDSLLPLDADLATYAGRLDRRLRPIVRRHHAIIEQVAAELLCHGTLTQERLDELFDLRKTLTR
jgi:hypothetical protein